MKPCPVSSYLAVCILSAGVISRPSLPEAQPLGQDIRSPYSEDATGSQCVQKQSFDVASVRLADTNDRQIPFIGPWESSRFSAKSATLELLLEIAFDIDHDAIEGAPKWIETQRYDVEAKTECDKTVGYEEVKPLLQALLTERLHLETHIAKKDVSGYALTLPHGSNKLRPSTTTDAHGQLMPGRIQCAGCSVEMFARMLSRVVGRPVVDVSGIQGKFDFDVAFEAEEVQDTGMPSIFTALNEQVGMKLQQRKVPQSVLVIDRVERTPTEN
jgi:uncharacterized protein (TIGR03435 family)